MVTVYSHLQFKGVNYCENLLLSSGLYCINWANSNFLFGQLLSGLQGSIMGCLPTFGIVCVRVDSHLSFIKCELLCDVFTPCNHDK